MVLDRELAGDTGFRFTGIELDNDGFTLRVKGRAFWPAGQD